MPPPKEEVQQRIARLEATQNELLADLKWLLHNQAALDSRLARVEDSAVFRTLRAIGRFYQTRIARKKTGASRGYTEWRARSSMDAPPSATLQSRPLISVRLEVRKPARQRLELAVQSVREQTYTSWELIPVFGEQAPRWAREYLGESKSPAGDWIVYLGENESLVPAALEHLAAAVQNQSVDMAYADGEVLAADGSPLRPIFKPDWSPVLLHHTPYLTGLRMERAGLAGTPSSAIHIPRILYRTFETQAASPRATRPLSSTPLVSIVICSRNGKLLARCLDGIRVKTSYPSREIVVVQHLGASDKAEEKFVLSVIQRFGARAVPFVQAFNFSEMNNNGAREASGEILLFLNDDVEPIGADWLSRMVGHLENPAVGAVGAKLLYPDGAIQHAGITTWLIDGAGHPGRNLFESENWPWLHCTREVLAVTGACMCVRRADFERLGGFDPVFPVNYNDVDLCLRLRADGLSVIFDADAVLRHDESQTRRPGTRYDERRTFFRRWSHITEKVDPYYSPHLVQNNEDLSLR